MLGRVTVCFSWERVTNELCCCRKGTSFVGLKNGGATCYMNSVFQQIFMQPSIRRLILSSKEAPKAERQDSVFYQLQVSHSSGNSMFMVLGFGFRV